MSPELNPKQRLHAEQQYVFEIAQQLGVEARILPPHTKSTISCAEKLDLLKHEKPEEFSNWTLDRIVKALYFSRKEWPFIGIITPELERDFDQREILPRLLWMPRSSAEKYDLSPKHTPHGMTWGTCTPFPLETTVGTEGGKIAGFLIVNYKPVWNEEVNISIGGPEKSGLRTSMHLPYGAIYEILRRKFGEDRIRLFNIF